MPWLGDPQGSETGNAAALVKHIDLNLKVTILYSIKLISVLVPLYWL